MKRQKVFCDHCIFYDADIKDEMGRVICNNKLNGIREKDTPIKQGDIILAPCVLINKDNKCKNYRSITPRDIVITLCVLLLTVFIFGAFSVVISNLIRGI